MTGSWVILELEEKAGEMLFNPAFVWSEHTPAGLMNGQGTCLASQSSGWNRESDQGPGSFRYQLHEYVLGQSFYSDQYLLTPSKKPEKCYAGPSFLFNSRFGLNPSPT